VHEVVVPKLNNNDATYTLVEWLFEDGAVVQEGDALVVIETSKAASELECEQPGVLHRAVEEQAECSHGQTVARVFATEEARQEFVAAATAAAPAAELVITSSARDLADSLGIDDKRLRSLGKPVIRRADIESLAEPAAVVHQLTRTQQGVAAVVTAAHRDIPAALAVVKVEVDAALRAARAATKRTGTLIGLPELVIKAMAARLPEFPLFFATPLDAARVRLASTADIGVTVDVGTGLFVPVVRSAGTLSAAEVADRMLDFRTRAMAGELDKTDLTTATIMLSLHTDTDVVVAAPIVHPGQTCVVCLPGTQHELALDDVGEVVTRRTVQLSICYDHRTVNGQDAVAFLKAIKQDLSDPDRLVTP
jgi:2-oxoglutarate dehydrogenase E2 component (dihydrolipoamide succinyltransferase)